MYFEIFIISLFCLLVSETYSTSLQCTKDQFKCDEKCYPLSIVCDRVEQCKDGLDEKYCEVEPVRSARSARSVRSVGSARLKLAIRKCTPRRWSCPSKTKTRRPKITTHRTKPTTRPTKPTTRPTKPTTRPTKPIPDKRDSRTSQEINTILDPLLDTIIPNGKTVWNITHKDKDMTERMQQFAIDESTKAFKNSKPDKYLDIAKNIKKAFNEKYHSKKWICSVNNIESHPQYKHPHFIILYRDDLKVRVVLYEAS